METLLFYHGGPGLNSNPEQHMLSKIYKDKGLNFVGWNEPSSLRGTLDKGFSGTRFQQLLHSAELFLLNHSKDKPVYIMGHSLGGAVAAWLAQKHMGRVKTVFLSAPCFHVFKADQHVFAFVRTDYEKQGDYNNAKKLKEVLDLFSGQFDENTATGWKIVLANPNSLSYYWQNKQAMETYFEWFSAPGFSLDTDSFFEVRSSLEEQAFQPSNTRTIVFFGLHDPVVKYDEAAPGIAGHFFNYAIHGMHQSSHYPHLEQANEVLNIIQDEVMKANNHF